MSINRNSFAHMFARNDFARGIYGLFFGYKTTNLHNIVFVLCIWLEMIIVVVNDHEYWI